MKKRVQFITWIVPVALATVMIPWAIIASLSFWTNSYSDAFARAGLSDESVYVVDILHDDSTDMKYHVVQTTTLEEGDMVLAILSESPYGIWNVIKSNEGSFDMEGGKEMSTIQIDLPTKGRTYPAKDEIPVISVGEFHFYACGNNALKEVMLTNEQIADNANIQFHQNGENWWVHMIYTEMRPNSSMLEVSVKGGFNIPGLLMKNGCISRYAD
ncbi:MAG: hypothetical protein E7433_01175 [Ruminococcaceae bacterium]|nr:hypothetical protein [Oscillospiraceae bacterium]